MITCFNLDFPTAPCKDGWTPGPNDACYFVPPTGGRLNFANAKAKCQDQGNELLIITSLWRLKIQPCDLIKARCPALTPPLWEGLWLSDWAVETLWNQNSCKQQGLAPFIMTTRFAKFCDHMIDFAHGRQPPHEQNQSYGRKTCKLVVMMKDACPCSWQPFWLHKVSPA